MVSNYKPITVAISGYFNPVHLGHLRMIEEAKKLGDVLIAIINNDRQVKLKGNVLFMNERERMMIVKSFKAVDKVVLSIDKDRTVCKTLARIKPDIFANGGDRNKKDAKRASSSLNPEQILCQKLGIKMVFNVGRDGKVQSSSWLLKKFLQSTNNPHKS